MSATGAVFSIFKADATIAEAPIVAVCPPRSLLERFVLLRAIILIAMKIIDYYS